MPSDKAGPEGAVKILVRRLTDLNERIEVRPNTGKFRIKGDPEPGEVR